MKTTLLATLVLLAAHLDLPLHADTPPAKDPPASYTDLFRSSAVTLVSENDKYFAGSDRHYTNGLKLSFLGTTRLDQSPGFIRWLTKLIPTLWDEADRQRYKVGISLGQNLYTPTDTSTATPSVTDRPYASWLYTSLDLQAKSPDGKMLSTVDLAIGMVGPAALGRQTQNGFHRMLGQPRSQGWDYQLHDELGLMLSLERRHRLLGMSLHSTAFSTDLVGLYGVSLGNIRTQAIAGFGSRLGWHLPADFGADLIRPSGGDESPASRSSLYVFANAKAEAVVRNIFLDGNTWKASPSVHKRPLVGDLNVGLVSRFPWKVRSLRGMQLAYTQSFRTKEFYGQLRGDVFGSISVSLLF